MSSLLLSSPSLIFIILSRSNFCKRSICFLLTSLGSIIKRVRREDLPLFCLAANLLRPCSSEQTLDWLLPRELPIYVYVRFVVSAFVVQHCLEIAIMVAHQTVECAFLSLPKNFFNWLYLPRLTYEVFSGT